VSLPKRGTLGTPGGGGAGASGGRDGDGVDEAFGIGPVVWSHGALDEFVRVSVSEPDFVHGD